MRVLLILALAARASAHDMWIEPIAYRPEAGDIVGMKLRVGQDLLGDPLPRDPALIRQFIVEDPEGRKPLLARNGADPAGFLRTSGPGLYVAGYFSNPSVVEQTPEKFQQYLKDEGLDKILKARAQTPQTSKVREQFTRCAKALVQLGPPAGADRALGFTLELVAERNPYSLKPGETLPLRLSYENKPLAGALVIAFNRKDPLKKLRARTDAAGRVRFAIKEPGMWLIKAVHMIPATVPEADYASFWASLTFEAGLQK